MSDRKLLAAYNRWLVEAGRTPSGVLAVKPIAGREWHNMPRRLRPGLRRFMRYNMAPLPKDFWAVAS